MKLNQFIQQEFRRTAMDEAMQKSGESNISELSRKINAVHFQSRLQNIIHIHKHLVYDTAFRPLKTTRFITSLLVDFHNHDFKQDNVKRIVDQMNNHPDNKLLKFIWIQYQINLLPPEEYDLEITFLLNDIFKKLPFLVSLENFFETGILDRLHEERVKQYPKLLLPVFEDAVSRYPQKLLLYYYLFMLFFHSGETEKAGHIYWYLRRKIEYKFKTYAEIQEDGFSYTHYSKCTLRLIENYTLNHQYDKALEIIDEVIRFYFNFTNIEKEKRTIRHFYIQLMLSRLNILFRKGQTKEIMWRYYHINQYFTVYSRKYLQTHFPDLMDFINREKIK